MERIETQRIAERDALLERLRTILADDHRIVSAWLYGSFGRGDQDEWSDLDVWIVLRDDAYSPSLRHEYAAKLGNLLLTEEAPQNGPPGGTYVMSAHDAPTGPHLVDWYLQPLRFAHKAESRRQLVDRTPLREIPEEAAPNPEFVGTPDEDAANKAALFWAMLLVQAKYIARKPEEDGMGFEGFILSLLFDVAKSREQKMEEKETPKLRFADDKLTRLRELAERMASVAPDLARPGSAVERFFQTVATSVARS